MCIHYTIWLALVFHPAVGWPPKAATPAAAAPGPLLLMPGKTIQLNVDKTTSNTSTATLFDELKQLKQEQESLESLMGPPGMPEGIETDSQSELAKRLRRQLEQLTVELGRQSVLKSRSKGGTVVESVATEPGRRVVSKLTAGVAGPGERGKPALPAGPVDPLALGQVLLRMEDYEGAVEAFRAVEFSKLRSAERAYAQYMLAIALRAGGRPGEAVPILRTIANSRADAMIAEWARWQLSLLDWQQELQSQLAGLRERRQALQPPAANAAGAESDSTQENP